MELRKPINILFLTTYTYPDFSGSGRHAFSFGSYLSGKGFRVRILSFNRNLRYKSHEEKEGVKFIRIPYFPASSATKVLSMLFVLPFYFYQAYRNNILIIYGSRIPGWEAMMIFGRIFGRRLLFRPLLPGVDDMVTLLSHRPSWLRRFYTGLLGRTWRYYSINEIFSQGYRRYLPGRDNLIEALQGVDSRVFSPSEKGEKQMIREKLGLEPETFLVISSGFVVPRKGISGVIDAMGKMDFPFIYIVSGENTFDGGHFLHSERQNAEDILRRGKEVLGEKILFTGEVENIQMYLKASDLFIHNSDQEGFPNALLEAMATGLCCLVKRFPGMENNLCRHDYNLLIYETQEELILLVKELYHEPGKRTVIGRQAASDIREKAGFDRITEYLKEFRE